MICVCVPAFWGVGVGDFILKNKNSNIFAIRIINNSDIKYEGPNMGLTCPNKI
jgi:hypothetical protein